MNKKLIKLYKPTEKEKTLINQLRRNYELDESAAARLEKEEVGILLQYIKRLTNIIYGLSSSKDSRYFTVLINGLKQKTRIIEILNNRIKHLEKENMEKELEIIGIEEATEANIREIIDKYYTSNEKCISKGKDETLKYINMIEAFECDFSLPFNHNDYKFLKELPDLIKSNNETLINDIKLLEELSFGLRHGYLKIYDVREEKKNDK